MDTRQVIDVMEDDLFPEHGQGFPLPIESIDGHGGRRRYRVSGLPMAWANSVTEAMRVAGIMLRSGLTPHSPAG